MHREALKNCNLFLERNVKSLPNGSRRMELLAAQDQVNPKKKRIVTPNLPPMMPETSNYNIKPY